MSKLFWVTCPKCKRKFYVTKDDFRHQDRKMMCPFCQARFLDTEADEVIDGD